MKFERTDVYTDKNGIEHYPLFASAFADMLAPEPAIDLSYDIEGLKGLLESEKERKG